MMQVFRNNTKIIIWVIVAAFVGTIIFAWGADITGIRGGGNAPSNAVGSVNGKDITLVAFNRYVDQYVENERTKDPQKDFTEADYRQARQQAWNDFVTGMLQQQEIDQKHIELTDAELVDFIRRYPPEEVQQVQDFQTNGKFDYQKYLNAMSDPKYAQLWQQVEALMRGRLSNFKLQEYVGSMVRVSDAELQDKYLRDNERIKVDYALVPLSTYDPNSIKIDQSQIEAYYNSHKDDYKAPELAYYTVIKAAKSPSRTDETKALNEINDIKAQLDAGANFDTLAMEKSQDPSGKNNGGELGWFGHGQMVAPFDSAVFAMKDGTISSPVKTQFGYHLIYRKASRVTNGKEEVDAAHILIKVAPSDETIDSLQQRVQAFREQVTPENYSSLLKQYGLTEDTQRKLFRNGGIMGVGRDADLENFLFDSKPGTLSTVFDRPDAYYIYRADKVTPPGISPLVEVTPMIEQTLKTEEQKKMAYNRAEQLYNAVMGGTALADAAKTQGLTVTETPYFTRTGRLATIGQDPNFIGTAFSLSAANRFSKPVITSSGAAIIEFKEKLPATLDGFAAQRDTLRTQEMSTLQNAYWNQWFNNLRDASEIKDYRKEHFGDQL